jgi:hypothetical protein
MLSATCCLFLLLQPYYMSGHSLRFSGLLCGTHKGTISGTHTWVCCALIGFRAACCLVVRCGRPCARCTLQCCKPYDGARFCDTSLGVACCLLLRVAMLPLRCCVLHCCVFLVAVVCYLLLVLCFPRCMLCALQGSCCRICKFRVVRRMFDVAVPCSLLCMLSCCCMLPALHVV